MATPLIRTLQPAGGTFYAFSSASRDLSKTFNNDQVKLEFSKFALLNIPDVSVPANKQNYIQFRTIDGSIFTGLSGDNNINLSQSFQNYALNLETLLLTDENYNSGLKKTTAERIFFKWLKELGAIRFRDSNNLEKNPNLNEPRFVEEDKSMSGQRRYQRVVEYVGNIDVTNSVQKSGQSYSEVYINVPTRVGNTPTILFESIEDDNYQPDMIISNNSELLFGRSSATIHPDGLSINAFYDYDANITYSDSNADWHNSQAIDSYFTEPLTFTDSSSVEITKVSSDYLGLVQPFSDINYLRSKLDGISIDFEGINYNDIASDPKISTLQEYNSVEASSNFEFNCVLVYYDIYDVSNPDDRSTNLYGVIFLDNLTPTLNSSYIQRLQKFKPNSVTGLNGNAWSLILNVKFDTTIDNSAIETVINEYSTFSMDLFIDASTQLQEAAKTLIDTQASFLSIVNRVNELENAIYSTEDLNEVKIRLSELESNIENSKLALGDSTALLDLISKNNDNINSIINGDIPIEMQYNTDVIKAGPGVVIDKSVPNKIKIENKNQKYNLNLLYRDPEFTDIIDINSQLDLNQNNIDVYIQLAEFTNMFRIYTENLALSNINIFINDTTSLFKEGQVLKFVWENELDLDNRNILIYTDVLNRFGQGSYNKLIATIPSTELISNKPIFELICLDEVNYTFAVDIIR
jgi:hypothetical protein